MASDKNGCDIMCEVMALGHHELAGNGGVYADAPICLAGKIAHNRQGKESRWLVPYDLLDHCAFWFGPNAVANIDETNFVKL